MESLTKKSAGAQRIGCSDFVIRFYKGKMNSKLMFSSKTDMWATPQDFFDKLNKVFRFDVKDTVKVEVVK